MKPQNFVVDLIFKPHEPGLRLSPELTQLLLANLAEILKEIDAEERLIVEEEERRSQEKEVPPCK
jgi:hypothetical protein